MKSTFALFMVAFLATSATAATIATVPVGNPNNPADFRYLASGVGSVPYAFNIGRTEVTIGQYVEFLNGVAASDPRHLYNTNMAAPSGWGGILRSGLPGSYTYAVAPPLLDGAYAFDNKPVMNVSWLDAIRFANWLHNGKGNGDTESGAYTLLGTTDNPTNVNSITRNPGARWWVPSRNEWYKAAYYNPVTGTYYDYATGTNTAPDNHLPAGDTGNSANYAKSGNYASGNSSYPLTDAGGYALSSSPYGTFDQSGNLFEWSETYYDFGRESYGGDWSVGSPGIRANFTGGGGFPGSEGPFNGFRVATLAVPEPGATLLVFSAGEIYAAWRRKRFSRI